MAELPASWGLEDKGNAVVGKDDAGQEYVALSKDHAGVTDEDLAALKRGDREQSTARELVNHFLEIKERNQQEYENRMVDDYTEHLIPVVKAGYGIKTFGYSRRFAANFDKIKWSE